MIILCYWTLLFVYKKYNAFVRVQNLIILKSEFKDLV